MMSKRFNANSVYLYEEDLKTVKIKNHWGKTFVSVTFALFFSLITLLSFCSNFAPVAKADESGNSSFDPVKYIMCDSSVKSPSVYQWANSEDLMFMADSKSAVSIGSEDVRTGPLYANKIISISSGIDFQRNNESVLGRPLDPNADTASVDPNAKGEDKFGVNPFNRGGVISPFDRFGVSGLIFTSYRGEWKYMMISACSENPKPYDPKVSLFYKDRLVPQSTFSDINNSKDPRSLQFKYNWIFNVSVVFAFINTIANWTFGVTKIFVALVIALINFSFSDIVSLIGIKDLIVGTSSQAPGLFTLLYKGIYMPFIVMMFTFTALYMAYVAFFKKGYRRSLNVLGRSLALLFIGIFAMVNPTLFIGLPNSVSTIVESALISGMNNNNVSGVGGLCTTDVASVKSRAPMQKTTSLGTDLDEASRQLETLSTNMRSAVDCSLWQEFLLKPWSQGQFGADWNELWDGQSDSDPNGVASSGNKIPDWATGGTAIGNSPSNSKMVGDAAVPMGGKKFLNNWAIFQISTQTNAHSPIGADGQFPKYTSGVANDWWRIADAMSNYSEVQQPINDPLTGAQNTMASPSSDKPLKFWDSWNGNLIINRWFTSLLSVLVSFVGLLAPAYLAFLAAMYSIGLALIMAFAPIMFLFGCWADWGWNIFREWGKLAIGTFVKRIITGVLLVISLIFTDTAIHIMEKQNWWLGIVIMCLLSIIIIRSRKKITDMIASTSSLTQSQLASTATRLQTKTSGFVTGAIRNSGKITEGAVVGGIASRANGGRFTEGVKAGIKSEAELMAPRNKMLRSGLVQYNTQMHYAGKSTNSLNDETRCKVCDEPLTRNGFTAAYTDGLDYFCEEHGSELEGKDGFDLDRIDLKTKENLKAEENMKQVEVASPWRKSSQLTKVKSLMAESSYTKDSKLKEKSEEEQKKLMGEVINTNELFISNFYETKQRNPDVKINMNRLPDEIKPYLPDEESITDALNRGSEADIDYVRMALILAWVRWFEESTGIELDSEKNYFSNEKDFADKFRQKQNTSKNSDNNKDKTTDIIDEEMLETIKRNQEELEKELDQQELTKEIENDKIDNSNQ